MLKAIIVLLLSASWQRPAFCHLNLNILLLYPLLLILLFPLKNRFSLFRFQLNLLLLVLLLLPPFSLVVLQEADMPCQAADSRNRLELVDHIAGDEVDIIVAQADASITNAFPPQLV